MTAVSSGCVTEWVQEHVDTEPDKAQYHVLTVRKPQPPLEVRVTKEIAVGKKRVARPFLPRLY